jgi:hypothetical protein
MLLRCAIFLVPKNTSVINSMDRVLPEKLTGLKLVKKFSAFDSTLRFITAFTKSRHRSLS